MIDKAKGKGRDDAGRFTAGNKHGRGNPHTKRIGQLRAVLMSRLSDDDLADIIDRLVKDARAGDLASAKVLLRYLGDPRRFSDRTVAPIPTAPKRVNAWHPALDRMVAGLA